MTWELTDLRASEGIRWAIGDPAGRRASTFRFWGNKKGDLYLAVRSMGGLMKTSLHRDGSCHTGLTADYAVQTGVTNRHMHRWTIPLDTLVPAVQVFTPEEDLAPFSGDERDPMRWLRAPAHGCAAQVGIIVLPTAQVGALGGRWPGAERTEPVGVIQAGARTAFAVHWENPVTSTQADHLRALRERVREDGARRAVDPEPGVRSLIIGDMNIAGQDIHTLFDLAYTA